VIGAILVAYGGAWWPATSMMALNEDAKNVTHEIHIGEFITDVCVSDTFGIGVFITHICYNPNPTPNPSFTPNPRM
jgi:hypothetical protein